MSRSCVTSQAVLSLLVILGCFFLTLLAFTDAMLDVLGTSVTPEIVQTLFVHAKEDFFEWRKDHDESMVLPDEMQVRN